jgi:guanylate kinase
MPVPAIDLLNISGPYGVGKDTLLQAVLNRYGANVHRVSTITTRQASTSADPTYRSLSPAEFRRESMRGEWLVNYQLSRSVAYGTSIDEINQESRRGPLCLHSVYASDAGAGELRRSAADTPRVNRHSRVPGAVG